MARRKNDGNDTKFGQFRSIYLDFNDRERREIVRFSEGQSRDLFDLILEKTTDGWKISVSYSAGWGTYICSITPKGVPDFPSNVVFIFRHENSARVCGFVHYFFGVMVPQADAQLRGEVSDVGW